MARDVVSFFIFFTKTKWNSIKLVRTKGKMAISPVSFFIYQKGFVASTQIPGCLLIIKEIALIVKVIGILPRILIGKQEPSRGYKRVIPKQLFGKYLVFVLVNIRSLWNTSFLERVLAEMRTMLFYLFYVVFCESSENGIKEFFSRLGESHIAWSFLTGVGQKLFASVQVKTWHNSYGENMLVPEHVIDGCHAVRMLPCTNTGDR